MTDGIDRIAGRRLGILTVIFMKCFDLVLGHEDAQTVKSGSADFIGSGVFDTALLNPHIYDVRCVLRQGEIAPGLHNEQENDQEDSPFMFSEGLKYFSQVFISFRY